MWSACNFFTKVCSWSILWGGYSRSAPCFLPTILNIIASKFHAVTVSVIAVWHASHTCANVTKNEMRHTRTYWNRNKKGNKWQHTRNFKTRYTVVLEILMCLSLIPGPTHLPPITSTFSISLIHYELTMKPNISASVMKYCMNYNKADTEPQISPVWRNQCVTYACFPHLSVSVAHCAREIFLCHSDNL